MRDFDNLPELYTQREVDRTRSRNRWLGRVEGAVGVVAFGAIMNLLGWIPSLLVLGIVGYVVWRLLKKPDEDG
ncbi:MAG: hypothetical protein R3195_19610 [Gemmatimonadota bacterium]|nr:hypothetical protein [Gemmatimonadota bacterium]